MPLSHSCCEQIVVTGEPLAIHDLRKGPPTVSDAALRELNAAAYLGVPLITARGLAVGAFCVVDVNARTWTGQDAVILRELADCAMTEVELRGERDALDKFAREPLADAGLRGLALHQRGEFNRRVLDASGIASRLSIWTVRYCR